VRDDYPALGEIVLWDVATRRELRRIGGHGGCIDALAFSPDGKILGTSGSNQAVQFWDVASGREIRQIDGAASDDVLALKKVWCSKAKCGSTTYLVSPSPGAPC